MPRAGGIYYFLDRSLGPWFGTIGGIGTWLALILKTAFALIGMGAYVGLFFPELPITPLAIAFALIFGIVNSFGAKKTGGFQVVLVVGLLITLSWFMGHGLFELKASHFSNFLAEGFTSIYATAGLVYISYVGLTNIASVSEEVNNPEKNLPLGMFLALGTAIVIYSLGTVVMVGIIPPADLQHDLTPVATAAEIMTGHWGGVVMTIAAILAFFSVSNAAILSASRYPLAMSRDHLLPRFFRILSKHRTPKITIYATVALIVICIIFFDPTKIAKLASTFQLLLFALSCLAVIIMRESRIESYDPGYRSPLYPWMPLAGVIAPFFLIVEMGWYPALFTIGLITVGTAWYFSYARHRVIRGGAIYHYFARLGELRFEGLDRELRGILKEKGLREEDPFDVVIARASLIDIDIQVTFEKVVDHASQKLAEKLAVNDEILKESFLQGTRVGATPVSHGAALPHMRMPDLVHPEVAIVRARCGVNVDIDDEFLGPHASEEPVYAFFFLVSPEDNPGQHLRLLAQIAGQMDDDRFMKRWLIARNEQEMKELLLRDDRSLSFRIRRKSKTEELIGKSLRELQLPAGCLIALIRRKGDIIIPRGRTVLNEGDRLTVIGEPEGIRELLQLYEIQTLVEITKPGNP
jgi:amino acid transporter/mannitol/fructose-specific phosphotransferase system IIA component (Ntr-type)